MLISYLESCQSMPVFKVTTENSRIKIPLDMFIEKNFLVVRPSGVSYDVAVIKESEIVFRTFIMLCTHADNPLRYNGNEFSCNLHGSLFNKKGKVEKGPAEKSLVSLLTQVENNNIIIKLI